VWICDPLNSFHYGPCNGSPPSPLLPPFLLPPSIFPIIVWTGGLLALDVRHSIYPLAAYTLPYLCPYQWWFLAGFPLNQIHSSSINVFPTCYCHHLKFLKFHWLLHMCGVRCTNFLSTMYAFIASEEHLELTDIYPACELSSISFCMSICPQALGNVRDLVGSSPLSIQFGDERLPYLGFVYESQVSNFEIFSSEVGCLVKVTFVRISRLL